MECPRCGFTEAPDDSSFCPRCGGALGATRFESGGYLPARYLDQLKLLLFHPRRYFESAPREHGLTEPLAVALVSHWLGTAGHWLWGGWRSQAWFKPTGLMDRLLQMAGARSHGSINVLGLHSRLESAQNALSSWVWGAGSVIADPFYTLIRILLTGAFIFIGARLLANTRDPRELSYESAVRITSAMACLSILEMIPFVGVMASWIAAVCVGVIGARECYRVGIFRALTILYFPQLVLTLLVAALLLGILLIMGGFMYSLLS